MGAPLARNRRATHDYQLHERLEAGIVLEGWEVKGIMAGEATLADSRVAFKGSEAWLLNCHINPPPNVDPKLALDPRRSRKLLLNASEIRKFAGKVKLKGLTVVVLDLHRGSGKIKATIALAKGRKLHDKRRAVKERELRREMRH